MEMLGLLAFLQTPLSVEPGEDRRAVLEADVPRLDVRDGELLLTREWEPDPTLPTDVHNVRRAAGAKRITLISDRGELTFELAPGTTREFWLELGDRRMPLTVSARTRPARHEGSRPAGEPVRIPLRIANKKLHLSGRINGSEELDLIFDTGASVCCLYPSGLEKGARFQTDLDVMNNQESRRGLELGGAVEVAGLSWSDEPVLFIEKQADRADGILGYTVFEDKVLEFDFTRMELVVHESLPQVPADFTRVPMRYSGSLTGIDVELGAGEWRTRGEFWLDTGSDTSLIVTTHLADELIAHLPKIGDATAGGVGPRTTRHALLDLPEFTLAGTCLSNVPILARVAEEGPRGATEKELVDGVVGMPVLQRFELLLDYPRGAAYLRPNVRAHEPFERRPKKGGVPLPATLAVGLGLLALGGRVLLKRRRNLESSGQPVTRD